MIFNVNNTKRLRYRAVKIRRLSSKNLSHWTLWIYFILWQNSTTPFLIGTLKKIDFFVEKIDFILNKTHQNWHNLGSWWLGSFNLRYFDGKISFKWKTIWLRLLKNNSIKLVIQYFFDVINRLHQHFFRFFSPDFLDWPKTVCFCKNCSLDIFMNCLISLSIVHRWYKIIVEKDCDVCRQRNRQKWDNSQKCPMKWQAAIYWFYSLCIAKKLYSYPYLIWQLPCIA